MTNQQPEEGYQIKATGGLHDGIISVELELGEASIVMKWPADDPEDSIDVLLGAQFEGLARVLDAIADQVERGTQGA